MSNLSNSEKLETAIRMIHFLLNASKTSDKNLPLKRATEFIENVYQLLLSATKIG